MNKLEEMLAVLREETDLTRDNAEMYRASLENRLQHVEDFLVAMCEESARVQSLVNRAYTIASGEGRGSCAMREIEDTLSEALSDA